MKNLCKWRRIFAIILAFAMITQNAWSVLADVTQQELDQRSGENGNDGENGVEADGETAADTQLPGQEDLDARAGETVPDNGEEITGDPGETIIEDEPYEDGGDEGFSASAYLSSSVTQEIYQQEYDGTVYNYVQLTAEVTNLDQENAASGVDVKVLLPWQVTYVNAGNQTGGMSSFNNPAEVYSYEGFDLNDIPQGVVDAHSDGQVMMWQDQTIGAGQTAYYTFTAEIAQGITSVQGMDSAWYINGSVCSYSWLNSELLIPAAQEEPEENPDEEPEENPDEEPEENPDEAPVENPDADDDSATEDKEEDIEENPEETYKTDFTYMDDSVIITAAAAEEAQLTQDTVLKAMRMNPGTAFYENAVATAESQLGAIEDVEYVCYDVYFELNGEKIEPKDGLVSITMDFRNAVFGPRDDAAEVDIIHIDEQTGIAEKVTDHVQLAADGDVQSVGFTVDSLSPVLMGISVTAEAPPVFEFDKNVPVGSYLPMDAFLSGAEMKVYDAQGDPAENYDPTKINASGGSFELTIDFKETSKDQMDARYYLKYEIPAALNIVNDIGPANLEWKNGNDYLTNKYGSPGAFMVDAAHNILYVQMNQQFVADYPEVVGDVKMWGNFKRQSAGEGGDKVVIKIGEDEFTLDFDGNPIEAEKSVSPYDEEKGFLFTINVTSYGKSPENVTITDTLGENLELVPGSVTVGGKLVGEDPSQRPYATAAIPSGNKSEFTIGLADVDLVAGTTPVTVKIQYYAKIKDSALVPNNGAVTGLDNTAVITQDGEFEARTVKAQGSYFIDWITKAAGEYEEDGTIQWTLTLNKDRKADTHGVSVKDTLTGDGLRYDTQRPIHVVIDKGDNIPEQYDVEWNDKQLSCTDSGWTYNIPEDKAGKFAYTFTYHTIVKAGGTDQSYGNMGTVSKGDSSVDTGVIIGPGTGAGEGSITKSFEGLTDAAGTKYAQWTAVIKVPGGGLSEVIFKDTLTGSHVFPDPLNTGVEIPGVSSTGYPTDDLKITRKSDTEMTILFGSEKQKESYLPPTGASYEVSIKYYTKLTSEEGMINNTASLSSVEKNGFTESQEEIKNYSFAKQGSINSENPKLLDWKITLSKNLDKIGPNNQLTIKDVLTGQHTYVNGSAKLLKRVSENDSSPEDYSFFLKENQTQNGVEFTISGPLSSEDLWTIEYQTQIDAQATDTSFANTATASLSGKEIGKADSSVDTKAVYITKYLNQNASVANSYRAKYSVEVDGTTLDLDNEKEAVYTITDYSDVYVKIQESTIKVQKKNADETWSDVSFGYQYMENETDPENNNPANKLEVTINSKGGAIYRLQYDAIIVPDNSHKPDDAGNLTYSNRAEFSVGQKLGESGSEGTVEIVSGGGGSSGAANSYIVIYKKNAGTGTAMEGAGFSLKKYNPDNKTYEPSSTKEALTDSFGKAAFGAQTDGLTTAIVPLAGTGFEQGAVYKLEETTIPEGFEKAEDVVFIFGSYDEGKKATYKACGLLNADGTLTSGAVIATTGEITVENHAQVNIEVRKEWEEGDNRHPDKVEVCLAAMANGHQINIEGIDSARYLNKDNDWNNGWKNLPKYYRDTDKKYYEIQYTVKETEIIEDGKTVYTPVIIDSTKTEDGKTTFVFTIQNIRNREHTKFQVIKNWEDNGNSDLMRPEKIWVQLQKKVGEKGFTDVKDYTYEYSTVINGELVRKQVDIKGRVGLSKDNLWKYSWDVLPSEEDGKTIIYKAVEGIEDNGVFTPVSPENPVKKGYTQTEGAEPTGNTQTFVNTYTWEKVDVPVRKDWVTNGDSDAEKGKTDIEVKLTAKVNGKPMDLSTVAGKEVPVTIKLTSENSWKDTKTWTGLAKYFNLNGTRYEIEYVPEETTVFSNGWTFTGMEQTDGVYVLTNTFTNDISVSAYKSWDDSGNQDGRRPISITFTLYRPKLTDGKLTSKEAGTSGSEQIIDDLVYEQYTPEGGDASIKIAGDPTADKWGTVTWEKLPPKWGYTQGADDSLKDVSVNYRVLETEVGYAQNQDERYNNESGYPKTEQSSEGVFVITNKYTPEKMSVKVTKSWNDNENSDGLRDSITDITLTLQESVYNGTDYGEYTQARFSENSKETAVYHVPAELIKTAWNKTWDGLYKFRNGKMVRYKVEEQISYQMGEPRTYEKKYTNNGSQPGYVTGDTENPQITVLNTYEPEKLEVTAKKFWDDGNDRDGVRQYVDSITFELGFRNVGETGWTYNGQKVTFLGEDARKDNISKTWQNLPKYSDGKKIEYSIAETVTYTADADEQKKYETPKYSPAVITGDSTDTTVTVTNTYVPETVAATVEKQWEDANNKDSYRPEELRVQLMKQTGAEADGTPIYSVVDAFPASASQKDAVITLNKRNSWSGGWDKLYKYEDGQEIKYAVAEFKDYSNNDKYTETTPSDNNPVYADGTYSFLLQNTHEQDEKDLRVVKLWNDNEDQLKSRPKEVEVRLYADGVPVKDYTVIETDGSGSQKEITYKGTVTLDSGNGWEYVWKGLPVNNDKDNPDAEKSPVKYTVQELTQFADDTYTVSYIYDGDGEDGKDSWGICNVKNTYKTDKTSVFLMKLWKDDGSAARPTEAYFQLYKQIWTESETEEGHYGEKVPEGPVVKIVGTKTSNVWRYTWNDLDRKANEKDTHEILYTVEEVKVPEGYQVLMSGEENVFTAINTVTRVEISKKSITGEDELPGAELKLYDKEALKKDENAEPVKSWISDEVPQVIDGLEIGKTYILREEAAPAGYALAEDIEFTVEADGKVQKVIMRDAPIKVEISKKTLTGTEEKPLEGAKLQILDSNGEIAVDMNGNRAEWTTTDSQAVITGLPAGFYTLRETEAPAGYYLADDIAFELTPAGEVRVNGSAVKEITMIDYPTKVLLSKRDMTGEEELPGAELAVYEIQETEAPESSENEEEGKEEPKLGACIATWTSGMEPHIITGLFVGKTYLLREEKAPAGYNVAPDIRFTVTEKGTEVSAADFVQKVTMRDGENTIWISKKAITGANELPGAILQILQGKVVIDEWTSGAEPHNAGMRLSVGESYILHEVSAPTGYLLADDISFMVNADGTVVVPDAGQEEAAESSDIITMRDQQRTVKILKKDEKNSFIKEAKLVIVDKDDKIIEPVWVTDGTPHEVKAGLEAGETYILRETEAPAGYTVAADVEFTVDALTELVEITMVDKPTTVTISKKAVTGEESLGGAKLQIIDKDGKTVVEPWVTEPGKDKTFEGILNVNEVYTLEEVTPPDYYGKAESIRFTINGEGKVLVNDKETEAVVMRDGKTRVKVSKTDITGEEELAGAVLQIIDKETAKAVDEWTTTDKPYYVEGKLIAGRTYILHEKYAPEGYAYAEDIEFVLKEDSVEGNEQTITMWDAKNVVLITKTDITGTKELPGAKLQLLDQKGNILEAWTSTNREYKITSILQAGEKYILRETEAPDGYWLAEDIEFTVNKDGKPTRVTMKDAPTLVKILKTDEKGSGLAGAHLVLKDGNGKEIDRWTTDGKGHVLEKVLVAGATYTLTELDAPIGYMLAEDVEFTVSMKQQIIQVTMKDLPETDKSGKLTVTKKVSLFDGDTETDMVMKNAVFYVGLFTDKEGTKPYGNIKPIRLANAVSGTAVFGNLPKGVYYVFETDASGKAVPYDELLKDSDGIEYACVADGTGTSVELDIKAGKAEGKVNLNNRYYELPHNASYRAWIDISKQVLKGTSQTTVNDTFYASIFTRDSDGVYELVQTVELKQNDTVNVEVALGGENGTEPITYYVFETDSEGNPVDLDAFEYEVSGEGKVTLNTSGSRGKITIVNKLPEDPSGRLIVQKVDGKGVGLAGAQFRLLDENGNVADEWISQASAYETTLNPGKYTLKEIKAPVGYFGGNDATITVAEDGTVSVKPSADVSFKGNVLKYVNKVIPGGSTTTVGGGGSTTTVRQNIVNTVGGKYVKTGDDTPIGFYLALLAAAAVLAGAVIIKRRKHK